MRTSMAKKPAVQLNREIAAAMEVKVKVIVVSVGVLFGWRPKLEETMMDVDEGRVSRSMGQPLIVSRLDSPRGAWMIMDGYH